MLNSPILDLVIALSFTFFLLGLIVSSLNEAILSQKKARNKLLQYAIENLFFDDAWKNGGLAQKIKENAFISSLKKSATSFPAYIPSRNFALALLDVLRADGAPALTTKSIREILQKDNSPIQGAAKRVLLALLDEAGDDLDKFIKGIENFFDNSMDRVVGWYKSKHAPLLLILSFGLAVILNVDTVLITKKMWLDKDQLAKTANKISQDVNREGDPGSYVFTNPSGDTTVVFNIDSDTVYRDTTVARPGIGIPTKDVQVKLKEAGIPFGWVEGNYPSCDDKNLVFEWATKLVGWLFTTFALYLGAPFWFDLLNKVVNVRGVGKKPATEKEKA